MSASPQPLEIDTRPLLGAAGSFDETLIRYATRLRLPSDRRDRLLAGAIDGSRDVREAMVRLQRQATDAAREGPLTPPLARSSMAPHGWRQPRSGPRSGAIAGAAPDPGKSWSFVGLRRRLTLLTLIGVQTWIAAHLMTMVLPYHGRQPLEIAILVPFVILFAWISAGFWTALAGFTILARRGDRYAITRSIASAAKPDDIPAAARTAVVMPICNEDVPRVFAGIRATYESLAKTGALDRFDFFVLSDSGDLDIRVAELAAWADVCRAVDGFGRVFYRWRKHRIKRKSGNIADFCRRWGRNYRYMIVLDADSVMSGDCLTRLVLLAEANPHTGIIQTAPRAAGRDTLFARTQQFASAVYGPLFTAGLHYWQLGESHYWGHNAIIRVEPFIKHCALARLPGRGALSGEILSHDFVEAALMRRAGWSVWIAYDLPGSYEEMPPNLLDELWRDRRWCQGNLMNFRLCSMKGLHPAHRAVFMTGVMAYLSAPLWFLFLILATALLAAHTLSTPQYFVEPYQLFPLWPEFRPEWAATLFSAVAGLLLAPKLLAGLLVAARGAHAVGGAAKLAWSVALEILMSALLAPIRMLFHTQFVLTSLAGRAVRWRSPPRGDAETSWGDAIRRHGIHTFFGVGWAAFAWWLDPQYLPWLLPVVGALIVSIPLSVYTSRIGAGRRLRDRGFFLIPEETRSPVELMSTRHYARATINPADTVAAAVDPSVNALVCAQRPAPRSGNDPIRFERRRLADRALREGFEALDRTERATLIGDPITLSRLHVDVWTSADAHASWVSAREREPRFAAIPPVDAARTDKRIDLAAACAA